MPEVGDLPRLVADLDGGALALNAGAVELIVGGEAPRYIVTYMELVDDQSRDLREAWDLVGDASASGEVEVTFGGQAADVPKRLVVGVDEAVSACMSSRKPVVGHGATGWLTAVTGPGSRRQAGRERQIGAVM